ncbi:MAG TPA: malic enzyme-like NAD(P)-binding protein, partial [Segeticoccus sp.]|uniref:NAD-dependent malic enzyme n=1 Tax=Segeticoccus sp. TaxID=2706531 RepID=UPI002D7F9B24
MTAVPSVSNSITVRLELPARATAVSELTTAIEHAGGLVTGLDIQASGGARLRVDVTAAARDTTHADELVEAMAAVEGVQIGKVSDRTFLVHLGGKLQVESKVPIRNRDDLSLVYTPGVARVCLAIAKNPSDARRLTIKRNTVAVVTDGTAVLGLGDIGPLGALPVMEGKAALFKRFAGIDAFPICLDTKDADEIVRTVKAISPGFAGINLEDISAPRCFEIEERLREELDIPVFHDDQHGTAIVVLAALTNALRVVGKKLEELRVVVSGAGAAGSAVSRLLLHAGVGDVVVCDSLGALGPDRDDLEGEKSWLAEHTNGSGASGSLGECVRGADVFVGVSAPDLLDRDDLASMA